MVAQRIAPKIEAAGGPGDHGKTMVPASSVEFRSESVHPNREGRIDPRSVVAELIVPTDAQALFERSVAGRAALLEHAIERSLQATGVRAVVRTPIHEPDRTGIVRIKGSENQFDAIVTVLVTGDRTPQQLLRVRVTRVMSHQMRVALSVGIHQSLHNAQSGPHRIEVFALARGGTVTDDSLDVPFVGI